MGLGVPSADVRCTGRSPSTISRELRRNAATRGGRLDYRASIAQWKAELQAHRPKTAKLVLNDRLRDYVQERLVVIRTPDEHRGQVRTRRGRAATSLDGRTGRPRVVLDGETPAEAYATLIATAA